MNGLVAFTSMTINFSFFTGLAGKCSNFYIYAYNSPLVVKDPTGRLAFIPILIGAGIGAVTYTITAGSDFTYGGRQLLSNIFHNICQLVKLSSDPSMHSLHV